MPPEIYLVMDREHLHQHQNYQQEQPFQWLHCIPDFHVSCPPTQVLPQSLALLQNVLLQGFPVQNAPHLDEIFFLNYVDGVHVAADHRLVGLVRVYTSNSHLHPVDPWQAGVVLAHYPAAGKCNKEVRRRSYLILWL